MKYRSLAVVLILVALVVDVSHAQQRVSGEQAVRDWKEREVSQDLYKRISSSELVVKATSLAKEPITLRGARPSMDEGLVGWLYTFSVDKVSWDKSHVPHSAQNTSTASAPPSSTSKLYIFVPTLPAVEGIRRKESFTPGSQYLLILIKPGEQKRAEWVRLYALDPDAAYYRTQDQSRGALEYPKPSESEPTPQVPLSISRLVELAESLDASNPLPTKMAKLQKLASSDDPVLRREASAALQDLK